MPDFRAGKADKTNRILADTAKLALTIRMEKVMVPSPFHSAEAAADEGKTLKEKYQANVHNLHGLDRNVRMSVDVDGLKAFEANPPFPLATLQRDTQPAG